jgi:hypothetical protein
MTPSKTTQQYNSRAQLSSTACNDTTVVQASSTTDFSPCPYAKLHATSSASSRPRLQECMVRPSDRGMHVDLREGQRLRCTLQHHGRYKFGSVWCATHTVLLVDQISRDATP